MLRFNHAFVYQVCCVITAVLLALPLTAAAQPEPGNVFREYRWTNEGGDAGGSLRVGGRFGYEGGPIELRQKIDLAHAVGAEVVVEKLLCHDGTRGLAISWNDHAWLKIPEAESIPTPQWEYQHHIYPTINVPLKHIHDGKANRFRMKVAAEHPWHWPQNLIYGVHLRVYYDADRKPHPVGRLTAPRSNAQLGTTVKMQAEVSSPNSRIARIDFLGHFKDVNAEGDGRYKQWHYHYVRAQMTGQIATATAAPWSRMWDTSWIPDQPQPFQLAAWITDKTGLTLFTEAVDGLTFDRGGLSVELCQPYNVPKKWVTRKGECAQRFRVFGDLANATAAQLVWSSWSPAYMKGLYINDRKVFDREGPRYASYFHRVPLEDLSVLKSSENVLKTGKTPKHHGKMVHGMEVNWPGIMVLIQYQKNRTD